MKYPVKKSISLICVFFILIGVFINVPVYAAGISGLSEKAKQSLLSEYSQYGTALSSSGYVTVNLVLSENTVFSLMQNGADYNTSVENIEKEQQSFIKLFNKNLNSGEIISSSNYLVNSVTARVKPSELPVLFAFSGIESASFSGSFSLPENESVEEYIAGSEIQASAISSGAGEGSVIAIIDSGINPEHESMKLDSGVITALNEESANEKINELGYGRYYSDKIPFYFNYADSNYTIVQTVDSGTGEIAHGMHVAGIAAGNSNYAMGVAPNAQILALRVFSDESDYSQDYDIVRAIEDAVFLGADVINMSLGSLTQGTDEMSLGLYQKAVNAAKEAGVLLVAAAGNSAESDYGADYKTPLDNGTVSAPACFDGFISVGSSANQKVSDFSSRGSSAELEFQPMILAPGEKILSSVNEGYGYASGTSMASPYISAACAVVKKQLQNKYGLQGEELVGSVYNILMNTADILGGQDTYTTREQGAGTVNLANAGKCCVTITDENGDAGFSLYDFALNTDKINRTLTLTNYGNNDITYTASSRICANKYSTPDHTVSFSSQTVTVKAGKTATIDVTIDINNAIDDCRYIEGYLIFTPNDGSPVLHASYMGFCGDWSEGSLFANGEGIYKPELAAIIDNDYNTLAVSDTFSPNGDGLCDYIYPLFYQLRNSSEIQTSILDADGEKTLSVNNTSKYIGKDIFSYYWGLSDLTSKYAYSPELGYLATAPEYYSDIYDSYVPLPDGDYVLRVEGETLYGNSESEKLEIPFSVDTTAPEITSCTLKNNNGMYSVTFTVNDEHSLASTGENNKFYAVITSHETGDTENIELKKLSNNKYSGTFYMTGKIFSLGVFDSAYNFGESVITTELSSDNSKDVIYCSLEDFPYYNSGNLSYSENYTSIGYDSVLSFYAQMGSGVKNVKAYTRLTLNGKTSDFELYGNYEEENNNIFNFQFPAGKTVDGETVCEPGRYKIWFKITTENGTYGSIDDSYSMVFIPEAPEIVLDNDVINVTPGKNCVISGRISSDLIKEASGLYINDTLVNIESDKDGYYFKYTLPYMPSVSEYVSIFLTDFTGNGRFSRVYLIVGNNYNIAENDTLLSIKNLAGSVNLISPGDESYNTRTGLFTVKGETSNRYGNIYINGKKIENSTYNSITDLYEFEADIPLVEGKNIINLTSDGYKNGDYSQAAFDKAYFVVLDTTPPQLSIGIESEEPPYWLSGYFDGICINKTGNFSFNVSSSDNIDRLNILCINEQLYFSTDLYSNISVEYNNSVDTPEIINVIVYDAAGNYSYKSLLLAKTMPVRGDYNYDSSITAADALMVLRCCVNLDSPSVLNSMACDVNNSGELTAADALLLLQYSVNKIDSF